MNTQKQNYQKLNEENNQRISEAFDEEMDVGSNERKKVTKKPVKQAFNIVYNHKEAIE